MAHRLRCRLFGALLRRDPLFFDSVRTGQLSSWLGQDIEVLQVRRRAAGACTGVRVCGGRPRVGACEAAPRCGCKAEPAEALQCANSTSLRLPLPLRSLPELQSRPLRPWSPQGTVAKLLGARGIRSAFETVGIIIVLSTLSWPLAVALLLSAPLLTPLIAGLSRQIGAASKASQAAANDVSAAASEVVENMRVVRIFAQQQRELTRFDGLLETAHKLALKARGGRGCGATGDEGAS